MGKLQHISSEHFNPLKRGQIGETVAKFLCIGYLG
jgi:hypothetical protein